MYWAKYDLTYLYYFLIFILDKRKCGNEYFLKSAFLFNFLGKNTTKLRQG